MGLYNAVLYQTSFKPSRLYFGMLGIDSCWTWTVLTVQSSALCSMCTLWNTCYSSSENKAQEPDFTTFHFWLYPVSFFMWQTEVESNELHLLALL